MNVNGSGRTIESRSFIINKDGGVNQTLLQIIPEVLVLAVQGKEVVDISMRGWWWKRERNKFEKSNIQ